MQFINYFLTSIIVYLGMLFGIVLAYISKEELKAGKKYFILIQKIILLLMIISLLFYYNLGLIINLLLIIVFVITLFYYKKIDIINYSKIIYLLLGMIFYLSSFNINLFIINSSLMFLYGFPSGSLLMNFKEKNYLKILIGHLLFVVMALLLFVFF